MSSLPPPAAHTIPPEPATPTYGLPRRSVAIALALASLTGGAYYGSLRAPDSRPGLSELAGPRRAAAPQAPVLRRDYPLRRVSGTHVSVRTWADVTVRGAQRHGAQLDVFLDTGTTLPLAALDTVYRLGLTHQTTPTVFSHGFSGGRTGLYSLKADQELEFSLEEPNHPGAVLNAVSLVAPDSGLGSDLVVAPQALGPKGGAVQIDLEHNTFSVCETRQACMNGGAWIELARPSCETNPELLGVPVEINGHSAELLLDTGGSTLLFDGFVNGAGLAQEAHLAEHGELIGSGQKKAHAGLLTGRFVYELGTADQSLVRRTHKLWKVTPHASTGAVACYPAGALGLDILDGCQLVISDAPSQAFLRCEKPDQF